MLTADASFEAQSSTALQCRLGGTDALELQGSVEAARAGCHIVGARIVEHCTGGGWGVVLCQHISQLLHHSFLRKPCHISVEAACPQGRTCNPHTILHGNRGHHIAQRPDLKGGTLIRPLEGTQALLLHSGSVDAQRSQGRRKHCCTCTHTISISRSSSDSTCGNVCTLQHAQLASTASNDDAPARRTPRRSTLIGDVSWLAAAEVLMRELRSRWNGRHFSCPTLVLLSRRTPTGSCVRCAKDIVSFRAEQRCAPRQRRNMLKPFTLSATILISR